METPKTTTIEDYRDSSSLGILLVNNKDINNITKKTGALAYANEYQVHYHFLNGRFTFPDSSIVDIAIPTCYFNYKQEVSGASVDFHLSDVDAQSKLLEPVANSKTNVLLSSIAIQKISSLFPDCDFEWLSVNLGTIHKHPGMLDKFSGTDLSTSIKNPGICFPLGSVEEDFSKPSFSSILLHESSGTKVARTEYRLANQSGTTIEYFKGRALTVVYGETTKPSLVEKLLNVKPIDTSYTTSDSVPEIPDFCASLLEILKELDFEASTQFISSDNVAVKKATYPTTYGSKIQSKVNTLPAKVPSPYSEQYKKIAAIIENNDKFKLKPWHKLTLLSDIDLLDHYNKLELLASYVPTKHVKVTITTIEDILKLQDDLWLETDDLFGEDQDSMLDWWGN